VQESNYLTATQLGKRISELYVDPATGRMLVEEIRKVYEKKDHSFGFLQLISQAIENYPLPGIRKSEFDLIQEKLDTNLSQLISPSPLPWDPEFEEYFQTAKLSIILNDWVNEKSEDDILSTYNLAPGNLRMRVQIAKWLIYATHEIARILGKKRAKGELHVLERRMTHGCKGELIPLVSLKGIGRVRARRLWGINIKNRTDLAKKREKASKLIGEKIISKALS
jgi:helicase